MSGQRLHVQVGMLQGQNLLLKSDLKLFSFMSMWNRILSLHNEGLLATIMASFPLGFTPEKVVVHNCWSFTTSMIIWPFVFLQPKAQPLAMPLPTHGRNKKRSGKIRVKKCFCHIVSLCFKHCSPWKSGIKSHTAHTDALPKTLEGMAQLSLLDLFEMDKSKRKIQNAELARLVVVLQPVKPKQGKAWVTSQWAAKRNRSFLLCMITVGTGLKGVFVCPRGGLNGVAWLHRQACGPL